MLPTRREFLKSTALATAAPLLASAPLATTGWCADSAEKKLRKALKFGMIRQGNSVEEKFKLIRSLGFEGVEIDSPSNLDLNEAVSAAKATGIVIHGVIDSIHWQKRLSDPEANVRAEGLKALEQALRDAQFVGATTVLLVPGKVTDQQRENFEQVWERSQAEVRKVLPLAESLKVKIGIEVVWNDFLTTPEQLIRYVDTFESPWVGAYFDCSNMLKYGVPAAEWIRRLGPRMLKFDFKGYSHEKKWVKIGEGDENWPEVLKALDEIGYRGWATAEVGGGGEEILRDISERMDRVLGLA